MNEFLVLVRGVIGVISAGVAVLGVIGVAGLLIQDRRYRPRVTPRVKH